MPVFRKNEKTLHAAIAAKLSAGKDESCAAHCCAALQSSDVPISAQAERLQGWPIDSRSNRQAIVGLERR